ncbi:MAG: hypothetical protein ACLPX1_03760 [Steroidobacteraceae bacterium]
MSSNESIKPSASALESAKAHLEAVNKDLAKRGLKPRTLEEQARLEEFHQTIGQALVDNLNRNVLREAEEMKPGADWSEWTVDGRTLRLSPDQTQARELRANGSWSYVVAEWVRTHATPGRPT